MSINREMRTKAKDLLSDRIDVDLPMFPNEGLDPEAIKNFLEAVKPLQYAALAKVIRPVVDLVTSAPLTPPTDKPVDFDALRVESQACFNAAIVEVSGSDVYQEAAEYPKLIGRLDTSRYSKLDAQLMGGSGTAAYTILGLLEILPKIIEHHTEGVQLSAAELGAVAKRSGRLAWRNAMTDADKMIILQDLMPLESEECDAQKAKIRILQDYKIMRTQDGGVHSVDYGDVGEVVVPKGYRHRGYEPLEEHTALKDVDFRNLSAIGCPVTLINGSMEQLWQWYLQAVIDNRLWEE